MPAPKGNKYAVGNPFSGRPTKYTDEILKKSLEYIKNYKTFGDMIPSVMGLCEIIDISEVTAYEWAKHEDKVFSKVLEKLSIKQRQVLINNGLSGDFNAAITKLVLTKHGYHDKQDLDVVDKTPPNPDKRKSRISALLDKVKG